METVRLPVEKRLAAFGASKTDGNVSRSPEQTPGTNQWFAETELLKFSGGDYSHFFHINRKTK